jgi:glycosyltransferase 2 family protein
MKRWRSLAGSGLATLLMAAIFYLYGGDLGALDVSNRQLLPNFLAAIATYSFVVILGALAWKVLLEAFGAKPTRWTAEKQLLTSQIGKYLPGNVAQYAGRAAMAIGSGVPAKIVGSALVTETIGILIGGSVAAVLAMMLAPSSVADFPRFVPHTSNLGWPVVGAAGLLLLSVVAVSAAALRKRWSTLLRVEWRGVAAAVGVYVIALLLLGVSLHVIVIGVSPTPVPISLSVAVFAGAWIAGLATPGAPGGLGVRESVITLGLAPLLGGPAALSVALLHRGVSVLGDIACFGLGLILPTNKERLQPWR